VRDFTLAPRAILETDKLNDGEKIIYLKLMDFAFNDVFAYPKLDTLADKLGVHVATVKRATRTLRELGLVRIYREHMKGTNTYVLIPIEWVSNLKIPHAQPVPEDAQYIDTKADFDVLIDEIRTHYEAMGRTVTTKPKKKSTATSTIQGRIDALQEKIDQGIELNARDFVIAFEREMLEQKNLIPSIEWGRDGAIMKKLFCNDATTVEQALLFIKTYVQVFDQYFKNDRFPYPKIQYLKTEFILHRVVRLAFTVEQTQQEETSGQVESF
jgi:hypothetical protein